MSIRVAVVASSVLVAAVALSDGPFFVSRARLDPVAGFHARISSIRSDAAPGDRVDGLQYVAVDSAGRVVAAGFANLRFNRDPALAVVRFRADGELDRHFGRGGIVVLPRFGTVSGLELDSADRPVVCGKFRDAPDPGLPYFQECIRLTSAGSLDPSFGAGGIARVGQFFSFTQSILRRDPSDDSMLVSDVEEVAVIWRIRPDGTLDPAYGGDGAAEPRGEVRAIAIDAGGRAIVATEAGVERLDADGTADATFGTDGLLAGPLGARFHATSVEIDREGRIVAFGDEGGAKGVFRFLPSGAPDPLFCERGTARFVPGVPAGSQLLESAVISLPRDADGPFAIAATVSVRSPGPERAARGLVVQSLDPLDPAAVDSYFRLFPVPRRNIESIRIASSHDGRIAYAVGSNFVEPRGPSRRSVPVLIAVDLSRKRPVPLAQLRVTWEGEVRVTQNGDRERADGRLVVVNDGPGVSAGAVVDVALDGFATGNPTRTIDQFITGKIRAGGRTVIRLSDSGKFGRLSSVEGRRFVANVNPDGGVFESDASDNTAVTEVLPSPATR